MGGRLLTTASLQYLLEVPVATAAVEQLLSGSTSDVGASIGLRRFTTPITAASVHLW